MRPLTEFFDTPDSAAKDLADAIQSTTVSGFVSKFKDIASDPKVQSLLKAGITDGDPRDEVVRYSKNLVKVEKLIPTQNEIGFDQSISNIITDQYGSLKSILQGKANVGGPIVIYEGRYIIDGHHRWSQVFAANPDASMEALNLKGDLSPENILKAVHMAIAIKVGEVPFANPKGINILNGVTETQVLDKVNSELTDKAKKIWADNGQKTNEEIAAVITANLKKMISDNQPISGAPGRVDMPQTDVAGAPADKLALLTKGIVNFKNPAAADLKRPRFLKENEKFICSFQDFLSKER